ncbi:MAG: nucleotidyltransferase domain-containing protein [Chloroflexota bacterium]
MATPILELPPEKLVQYRRAAASRQSARADRIKPRAAQAWKIARQAARLLQEQFHATRVVVFGSLLHEQRFHEWSDIDLAAWGIPAEQTFRAIGAVMDLDRTFEVNLVDVNTCPPSLLVSIEQEGKDL